jgi:hypothetical protein
MANQACIKRRLRLASRRFYVFLNDRGSAFEQYKILKNLDSELANKLYNIINE